MDFSSYIEDKYSEELQLEKKPAENNTAEQPPQEQAPIELNDETKKDFYDFDIDKNFIGTFHGPGRDYVYRNAAAPGKDFTIATWLFKDRNALPWLLPQWDVLNAPQNDFKGFPSEEPDKYIYNIAYLGKDEGKHNIAIFKKPV